MLPHLHDRIAFKTRLLQAEDIDQTAMGVSGQLTAGHLLLHEACSLLRRS
jgi:hypothetical protein